MGVVLMSKVGWCCVIDLFVLAAFKVHAQSYSAVPRWGQASVIIYDILFIHGGKTDPSHQFTYTSAPNSNDLLTLDLSTSFSLSAPPWSYVSGSQNSSSSQGPAVAFHTLTPYTISRMLLFGGDPGFDIIGTNADSAWLLDVTDRLAPVWTSESTGWASEPIRRIYHAAPSASGAVYILGGQKGDDSQLGFSESYVFNAVANGGLPGFVPLSDPTSGAADLFGHVAHVLPDGTLIVFGGFFSSSNAPSPLTTIYMLNTTSPSQSWSAQNASGITPSNRRGFASVLLDGGKILIHGGADASLQNVYSDGALLDTTQIPMHWSPVSLADGLGARVGHFAAPIGGRVLFGLGWAGNGPASADLALYDPISNTFASSYTPASTAVSVTTLPVSPTAPGGNLPASGGAGHGGTGVGSPPTSLPGSNPTHHGQGGGVNTGGNGNDGTERTGGSNSHTVGIVLGSVLGLLSFVALAGASAYYVLRRRERRAWMDEDANTRKDAEGRWQLMPGEWDADDSLSQPGGLQMAGTGWYGPPRRGRDLWGLVAFIGGAISRKDNRGRRRVDMLADEDAWQFDVDGAYDEDDEEWDMHNAPSRRRREGTGESSLSFGAMGTGKSSWSEMVNASVTSLRTVLGLGAAGMPVTRERRGREINPSVQWKREGVPLDPFSDTAAIDEEDELTSVGVNAAMRPQGRESSKMSNPYVDPFSDTNESHQNVDHVQDEAKDRLHGPVHDEDTESGYPPSGSSRTSLPPSTGMIGLPCPAGVSSGPSTSVESPEAPSSRTTNSNSNSGTRTAISSLSNAPSKECSSSVPTFPRTTSIIGAVSTPATPMRRSDSWWLRFSRTSFRDRYTSHDSTQTARTGGDGLLEFRDPNPAPRLRPIKEASQTSPQIEQEPSPDYAQRINIHRKGDSGYAASTRSSIKTDDTVDSEAIERLGGQMEVVQRALSLQSRRTSSPGTMADSLVTPYGPSTMETRGSEPNHRRLWTGSSLDAESLTGASSVEIERDLTGSFGNPMTRGAGTRWTRSRSSSGSFAPRLDGRHSPRRSITGAIASRVSAYEKRVSQDAVPHQPHSPPADVKSHRMEREEDPKQRSGVGYGLVPRTPLFVANPDRRELSGSS